MVGASGVDAKSRFEQGSREAYRTQRKLVDSDLRAHYGSLLQRALRVDENRRGGRSGAGV